MCSAVLVPSCSDCTAASIVRWEDESGQVATAQALTALTECCARAAETTVFVQELEVFDQPYTSMGGESEGGAVGMGKAKKFVEQDF